MNLEALTRGKTSLIIGLIFILLICVGYRTHKIANREVLHMDEVSSLTLANYSDYGWNDTQEAKTFEDDSRMFTAQEMKREFYSDDNSLSEVMKDICRLHSDTRDISHTNFYYTLLRLSLWGADSGEYNQILLRAGALNMLLFLIGFFFLFKLIRLFTTNNFIVLSLLLLAFMSPGSVYSTFSFRFYQLQETMFCILTYFSFAYLLRFWQDEQKITIGQTLLYALVLGLTMLTGYFSLPYALLMWGCLLLAMLIKRQGFNVLCWTGMLVLAFFLTYILYPNYFSILLFSDKAQGAALDLSVFTSISAFYSELVKPSLMQMNVMFIGADKLIPIFLLIAIGLGYYTLKEKKKIESKIWFSLFLIAVCFIWITVIVFLSPWKGAHYYRAIFPVLTVAIFIPLYYPQIRVYYAFLVLAPVYMFLQLYFGEIDGEKLKKGSEPIIFCGKTTALEQLRLHIFYRDDRLIGFSFDKENVEKKLEELDQTTIVAIVLARDMKIYTEEEYTKMPNFNTYIDTAKYKVVNQKFDNSFNTLFYLEKKAQVEER